MIGIIFFSFQHDWLVFCLILLHETKEENFDQVYLCFLLFCACLNHHDMIICPKFSSQPLLHLIL